MPVPEAHRAGVLDAIRRAVKARVQQWDAELEAETLVGTELDTAELVEHLAAACDTPESAMTLPEEDILPRIDAMLN